jgi:LDH2 family malate/lactate/ureidoglycolate dehydrogenase
MGYVVLHRCVEIVLEKVRVHGMAVVGAGNCWFSGRNAYYLEAIARGGYVGIHVASGNPAVVPTGARRPFLGTNPVAIAIPRPPDPLVFDMGTASTMWGEVLLRSYLGEPFPEGIGIDADGNPTTDAAEIVKGGVLPFGGYKGYGLSVMIQALALMAGAQSPNGGLADSGFLFIAFDPALLGSRDAFAQELERMIADLKALPRQKGVDEIRLPSERAYRERRQRMDAGFIEIGKPVFDRLVEMRSGAQ